MIWHNQDFTEDSDSLIIFLGANRHYINLNKYEWSNMVERLTKVCSFKKLFIRDNSNSWWQTKFEGLSGHGPHSISSFIKEKIKESGVKRSMIIGASMGGYGAILFGCLCMLDLAIAISPQTYLAKKRYRKNNLEEKFKGLEINKEETDLRVILERYSNEKTNYHLYLGKYNKVDVYHAERLINFKNVKLLKLESSEHTVASVMRDNGMTKDIILKFIEKGV